MNSNTLDAETFEGLASLHNEATSRSVMDILDVNVPDPLFLIGVITALICVNDVLEHSTDEAKVENFQHMAHALLSASCYEVNKSIGKKGYTDLCKNFYPRNPLISKKEWTV